LLLIEAAGPEARHLPIDSFLRTLADDQKERAVCIILSGAGADGTLGLMAIKAEGGMAMVQDSAMAKYAGMPSSAMATGLVDYVLPPAAMPAHLVIYVRGWTPKGKGAALEPVVSDESLQKILVLLRSRTRNDFSSYKLATIRRRIQRRMNVQQIREPKDYIRHLQVHSAELDVLFKELLISVTSFFRDRAAWEVLAEKALPERLGALPDLASLRIWVPGCATGEEAYSIAIILRDCMDRLARHFDLKVFATDLDAQAIETARLGIYPEGIAADVPPPWLARYFECEGDHYRIAKEIRESVIFATQNVFSDPPFTKLDLISCRNLFIYLNADLQQRLLALFHHALKSGGLLLLGSSETIGDRGDLFGIVDRQWKLFSRLNAGGAHAAEISTAVGAAAGQPAPGRPAGPGEPRNAEVPPGRAPPVAPALPEPQALPPAAVADLANTAEELKSANEELQSANEELQSTNEELETSREELQSLNEELTTVNAEQHAKVDELARARDDMQNLLNSTEVATIFLDNDLRIRRYTETATNLIHLIPTDIGRPISDQTSNLEYHRLVDDCREVLKTLRPKQIEVATKDGAWQLMRILPYRTIDNAIDGVVITLVNITDVTLAEKAGREARAYFESIFNTVREPLLVLDGQLRIGSANQAFYKLFRWRPRQIEGDLIHEIGCGEWDQPELRQRLRRILPQGEAIDGLRLEADFPKIGHRVFLLNARRLQRQGGLPDMILLAVQELTGE
jgi:two-component system CheB/CheR fusion protein